jgi:hypothetical protein
MTLRWILETQVVGWKMDGTGSGSCPVLGFGISGAKFSPSTAAVLD